jgi:type I restriction enzyme, S subunit
MNNETVLLLEGHFDAAFAAPDGIKKLRELILTLAMQGKLVPQDLNDEPASELLKAIEAEKQRLVKEGKIRKSKLLPRIKPDELPYLPPKGWEWSRLGNYCYIFSGNAFKSQDFNSIGGTKTIKITNAGVRELIETDDFLPEKFSTEYLDYQVRKNDLILALTRPYISSGLKISICPLSYDGALLNQRVAAIRPFRFFSFVFQFLCSPHVLNIYQQRFRDSGLQPNLKTEDVTDVIVPIPPLAEQHRIVAEIDRLMARCDELEKLRADRSQKLLTVHTAALDNLLKAKESSDFSTAWHFITQNFSELYSVKENVAELRKTILQLAVMGKLVPQDPNDEPASELLKAIEFEKQRLVKEGKIKLQKPLSKTSLEEMPYSLPNGWEWSRLEDIVDISSGVTKGRKLNSKEIIALPYLRVANVQRGYLDLDIIKEIEIAKDEIERFELKERDLLITEGGDWDKVGRTAIWKAEIPLCIHQNHIFKARRLLMKQNEKWIEEYMNSSIARTYFANASKQTTNLASINKTQLRGCPIPLPPLAEQQRIVAEINRLMALCDRLEESIEATKGKQTDLLNALMSQV